MTRKSVWSKLLGERIKGFSGWPMSPLKISRRVRSPSTASISIIAEPRMWPASWKTAARPPLICCGRS